MEAYKTIVRKRGLILTSILGFLIAAFLIDLMVGASSLTIKETIEILLGGPSVSGRYTAIVWGIRLPSTLTCLCVGASLGLAGCQMQTILDNPLASPYTLGISTAAGFGAAFSIVFGFPYLPIQWLNIPASALIFALFATAVIALISSRTKQNDVKTMILFGVALNFFFQALQTLLQYLADQKQSMEILHWLFGSLSKASWTGVWICSATFIIIFIISIRYSWPLTAFSLGEERARSLGIETGRLRVRIYILTALLTGVAVSYVGSIGFIGLVAPHLARMYVGEDQRYLIPLSSVFGVCILIVASIISKIIKPGVIIPVGIVTNLVGVCFLTYLMLRRRG